MIRLSVTAFARYCLLQETERLALHNLVIRNILYVEKLEMRDSAFAVVQKFYGVLQFEVEKNECQVA